jgi:AraC family transcriptional regulator
MSIQVFLFDGAALCFGSNPNSNPHSHLALQLTFALGREFVLHRPDASGAMVVQPQRFACLAPDEPHHVAPADSELAYLYVDCGPVSYARWRDEGGQAVEPDAALREALLAFRQSRCSDRELALDLALRWRGHSLAGLVRGMPAHPRLAGVVEYVDAAPLDAGNHASLARRANLSPSRFAHLFREETGLPVRNYLLWRRLIYALECLQQGQSITAAAYEAGFTDGAHLSRSFRRVLGSTPADLRVQGLLPPARTRSAS